MLFKRIFTKDEIAKRFASSKNIFGEHIPDIKKKGYVALVFVLNICFTVALGKFVLAKIGLLSIPFFITLSWWPLIIVSAGYLLVLFAFGGLRTKATKDGDADKSVKLHKKQLIIQASVLVLSIVLVLMLNPSTTIAIPGIVRWVFKAILFGILFETFRLSFYSIQYALKAILSLLHYKKQNIYAVVRPGKKGYVALVFVLNIGFIAALFKFVLAKVGLLTVPFFVTLSWWPLLVVSAGYLLVLFAFGGLRAKATKNGNADRAVKLHKAQLIIQAFVLALSIAFVLMANPTITIALP
jgi:arginine exporter protein ArgO